MFFYAKAHTYVTKLLFILQVILKSYTALNEPMVLDVRVLLEFLGFSLISKTICILQCSLQFLM